jgi:hypothetical protein
LPVTIDIETGATIAVNVDHGTGLVVVELGKAIGEDPGSTRGSARVELAFGERVDDLRPDGP